MWSLLLCVRTCATFTVTRARCHRGLQIFIYLQPYLLVVHTESDHCGGAGHMCALLIYRVCVCTSANNIRIYMRQIKCAILMLVSVYIGTYVGNVWWRRHGGRLHAVLRLRKESACRRCAALTRKRQNSTFFKYMCVWTFLDILMYREHNKHINIASNSVTRKK